MNPIDTCSLLRYSSSSPAALANLWLNVLVLVPEWNRDPNVLFLMDTVIRGAFFHLDAKAIIQDIFHNLFMVCFLYRLRLIVPCLGKFL